MRSAKKKHCLVLKTMPKIYMISSLRVKTKASHILGQYGLKDKAYTEWWWRQHNKVRYKQYLTLKCCHSTT